MATEVKLGVSNSSRKETGYVTVLIKDVTTDTDISTTTKQKKDIISIVLPSYSEVVNDRIVDFNIEQQVQAQNILNAVPPDKTDMYKSVVFSNTAQAVDNLAKAVNKVGAFYNNTDNPITDTTNAIANLFNNVQDTVKQAASLTEQIVVDMFNSLDGCCLVNFLIYIIQMSDIFNKNNITTVYKQDNSALFKLKQNNLISSFPMFNLPDYGYDYLKGFQISISKTGRDGKNNDLSVFIPNYASWYKKNMGSVDEYYKNVQKSVVQFKEMELEQFLKDVDGAIKNAVDFLKDFNPQSDKNDTFGFQVNQATKLAKQFDTVVNTIWKISTSIAGYFDMNTLNTLTASLELVFNTIVSLAMASGVSTIVAAAENLIDAFEPVVINATLLDSYELVTVLSSHAVFAEYFNNTQTSLQYKQNFRKQLADAVFNYAKGSNSDEVVAKRIVEAMDSNQKLFNGYITMANNIAAYITTVSPKYASVDKLSGVFDDVTLIIEQMFKKVLINQQYADGDTLQVVGTVFNTNEIVKLFQNSWSQDELDAIATVWNEIFSGEMKLDDVQWYVNKFEKINLLLSKTNEYVIDVPVKFVLQQFFSTIIVQLKLFDQLQLAVAQSLFDSYKIDKPKTTDDVVRNFVQQMISSTQKRLYSDNYGNSISVQDFKCGNLYRVVFELFSVFDFTLYTSWLSDFIISIIKMLMSSVFTHIYSLMKKQDNVLNYSAGTSQNLNITAIFTGFSNILNAVLNSKLLDVKWIEKNIKSCLSYIETGKFEYQQNREPLKTILLNDMFEVNSSLDVVSLYKAILGISKSNYNTDSTTIEHIVAEYLRNHK